MRKRFEDELELDRKLISETPIFLKSRDEFPALVMALLSLYKTPKFRNQIFDLLEEKILKGKKKTGRPGLSLWQIFVLAEVRLALNIDYDRLSSMVHSDSVLRQLLGIESITGFHRIDISYQRILDNVHLLDDKTIKQINHVIVSFSHDVYEVSETTKLQLKTDSFVLETNVHFPTDYNLLLDSSNKALDIISKFQNTYPTIEGWRKIEEWRKALKNASRSIGVIGKSGGKEKKEREKKEVSKYLIKARKLVTKLKISKVNLPQKTTFDLVSIVSIERFITLIVKHIDLLERRVIKEEKIPHEEKIFSIFEEFTEWISKGKRNIELGKKVSITTDQFGFIIDYHIMNKESDSQIVIATAERIKLSFKNIFSWSFDKGYWHTENKEYLKNMVENVIMPKKGKPNKIEKEEEHKPLFKKLRNKHSAVESNINELENSGLDKCLDKGENGFARYTGLGVVAFNLKKVGKKLIQIELIKLEKAEKRKLKSAA